MSLSKGQSSGLDLIASYGWVVLVGIGAAVILSQMGVFRPIQCGKTSVGFSQVVPADWIFYPDSNGSLMSLDLVNWAGDAVEVYNVSASFGDVGCSGIVNAVLNPGDHITFAVDCNQSSEDYQIDDCYSAWLEVSYQNLVSGNYDVSRGRLRGSFEKYIASTSTTTTTSSTTSTTTTTTTTTTSSTTTITSTTTSTTTSSTTTTTTTPTTTTTTTTSTTTTTIDYTPTVSLDLVTVTGECQADTAWGSNQQMCFGTDKRCYSGSCITCGGWMNAGYCWYNGALGQTCTTVCSSYGGTYPSDCGWVNDPTDCSTCIHFFPGKPCWSNAGPGPYEWKAAYRCYYYNTPSPDCNWNPGNFYRQCSCNQ